MDSGLRGRRPLWLGWARAVLIVSSSCRADQRWRQHRFANVSALLRGLTDINAMTWRRVILTPSPSLNLTNSLASAAVNFVANRRARSITERATRYLSLAA